jgi:hypothetical protein
MRDKKLENQTRLEVLSEALVQVRDGEYICKAITEQLERRDIITAYDALVGDATNIALEYFPELLKYKPEEVDLNDDSGWFGECGIENAARRVEVMRRLVTEIAEQEPENIAVGYQMPADKRIKLK